MGDSSGGREWDREREREILMMGEQQVRLWVSRTGKGRSFCGGTTGQMILFGLKQEREIIMIGATG